MSNFEINVETDGQTDGRMGKRVPMSQSGGQGDVSARFDGCIVL